MWAAPELCASLCWCPSSTLSLLPPQQPAELTAGTAPLKHLMGSGHLPRAWGRLQGLRSPPLRAASSAEQDPCTNLALQPPESCCCQRRGRESPAPWLGGANEAPLSWAPTRGRVPVAVHWLPTAICTHSLSFILVLLICCCFSSDVVSLEGGQGKDTPILQRFSSLPFRSRPQST